MFNWLKFNEADHITSRDLAVLHTPRHPKLSLTFSRDEPFGAAEPEIVTQPAENVIIVGDMKITIEPADER